MNICQAISDFLRLILLNEVTLVAFIVLILIQLVRGHKITGMIKTYVGFIVLMFVLSIMAEVVPTTIQLVAIIIVAIGTFAALTA